MTGLKMKYFVLKPEGDDRYATASREAMREYARSIKNYNPTLAIEIIKWADSESLRSNEKFMKRTRNKK